MTSPPHTPPLAPSECLGFSLRKTLRGFAQIYDEAFRPLGIKASQYNLLAAITHLGPVAQKDLAGFLCLDKTTLTRNLRPLEREDLIRTIPGADRRVREVSLTPLGEKFMAKAYPVWQSARDRVAARMGENNMDALIATLATALDAIESDTTL